MIRLTVRATDESVPAVLIKLMEERLAAGESSLQELAETKGGTPSRVEISEAFGNVMVT
jgi:AP-2 complex subunit alpha